MATQRLCPSWPTALKGQREDWNNGSLVLFFTIPTFHVVYSIIPLLQQITLVNNGVLQKLNKLKKLLETDKH